MDFYIEKLLYDLNINKDNCIPIGNHELNRHKVYKFNDDKETKIIKIYYKKFRLENELYGYKIAKKSSIPSPKIFKKGNLDKVDFLIMENINGLVLSKSNINYLNKKEIYYDIGYYLGKLHSNLGKINVNYKENFIYSIFICKNILINSDCSLYQKNVFLNVFKILLKYLETISFSDLIFGFCHGDFDERNIIQDNNKFRAFIDFESSHYGNTEMDLVQIYRKTFLKDSCLLNSFTLGYKDSCYLSLNFNKRLPAYLIADSMANCAWSFNKAPEYFEENFKFLEDINSNTFL